MLPAQSQDETGCFDAGCVTNASAKDQDPERDEEASETAATCGANCKSRGNIAVRADANGNKYQEEAVYNT